MGNKAPVIGLGETKIDGPVGISPLRLRSAPLEEVKVEFFPSLVDFLPGETLSRPSLEFLQALHVRRKKNKHVAV
jgi:hypothetical protein